MERRGGRGRGVNLDLFIYLVMKKTLWALVRSTSGGRVALARWTVSDIFELALDECNLLQRRRGENTALN